MDKFDRRLAKIPHKERLTIERIIEKVVARDFTELDVKKLKGVRNIFRVRKGRYRVIFELGAQGPRILSIERRSERTYNF